MTIDFNAFLKYVLKYAWVLVLVVLISMTVTYFYVKDFPDSYRSQAQIATESQQFLAKYAGQQNEYSNVVEMLLMRRVINLLSYQLIIHDLQNPSQSFRPLPEEVMQMDSARREMLIVEYKKRLLDKAILTVSDNDPYKLSDIVNSMGYGDAQLFDALLVEPSASNMIKIEFVSENPDLSVYAVNTLATEFIHYYHTVTTTNNNKSLALLDSMLREKQAIMNAKAGQLQSYKSSSGVLDVSTQSGLAYQRVSQYEGQLAQVLREIESTKGAIARLNDQLRNSDEAQLNQSVRTRNNDITQIEDAIAQANKQYLDNGFRPEDKKVVDSLQQVRLSKLAPASTRSNSAKSAATVRESLLADRMQLETALALAEGSVSSIQRELSDARQKYNMLVPTDAGVQRYERESEVATNDYLEALSRFNQASLEKTAGLKLNLIEPGLPGLAEPSKSPLYIGLSGIAGVSLSFFVLFVVFLFDHRIVSAQQLAFATKGKVVGNLNLIKERDKDLRNIWSDDGKVVGYTLYRDLLRSLRFEVNSHLSESKRKVLGITSLNSSDGKTFLASGLAYSFAMIGKKVLLIGEDYTNLTDLVANKKQTQSAEFEKFLVKKEIQTSDFITVMNRNPNNTSLLEMKDADNLVAGFEILRQEFDIIIVDINSLKDINRVKEWLMFVDASIAVFAFGETIKPEDSEFVAFINKQPGFLGWILNKIPVKHKLKSLNYN